MEIETINFIKYKMGSKEKSPNILLTSEAVPSKFYCQEDSKMQKVEVLPTASASSVGSSAPSAHTMTAPGEDSVVFNHGTIVKQINSEPEQPLYEDHEEDEVVIGPTIISRPQTDVCPLAAARQQTSSSLCEGGQSVHVKDQRDATNRASGIHLSSAFSCNICDQTFADQSSLASHLTTYIGEDGPYICQVCDNMFKTKISFTRHLVIHSTAGIARPYVCRICSKSFKTKHNLKQHSICHIKARPYACDTCNKAFKRIDSLKKHLLTHIDTYKPFSCEICGRRYKLKETLSLHVLHHNASTFE